MKQAHHTRHALREAGIQPSASRMAIAHYVWNTTSHPTADDVKLEVEKNFPTVSLATVYNTLNLFVEKGLLKEVKDPNSDRVRYDCNTKPHFHFLDEETGEMLDLDPRALKISPNHELLGKNFEIKEIEVVLKGRRSKN
jgi:Fur family iron response transcriptional regulator